MTDDRRIMNGRGECKTPNGKLVAVSVRLDGDDIIEAHLDGDFLIDDFGDGSDDTISTVTDMADDMTMIADVEQTIVRRRIIRRMNTGHETDCAAKHPTDVRILIDGPRFRNDVDRVIAAHPHAELIGTTADAIVTATGRAIASALRNALPDAYVEVVNTDVTVGHESVRKTISRTLEFESADSAETEPHAMPAVTPITSETLSSGLSPRWHDLTPGVILDPEPNAPPMQMALDQALAQAVAAGEQPPTLRFWNWGGPAVVIGAYQSVAGEVNESEAEREGFTVVRRVTGGGAMFVRPADTITYSLYVPESFTRDLDPVESYRLCDEWAFAALHAMGIPAVHQPINDIATPSGGKIGGAAQRRFPGAASGGPGCILHHVTMAYRIDAAAMGRILRISKEKLKYKVNTAGAAAMPAMPARNARAVVSANKRVQPLATQTDLTREQIIHGMINHALADIPGARSATIPAPILARARTLAATRFTDPAWTHRIP